ncbi:MAG: 30S ribosomal protein S21 [Candidatus Aminicenantes bacterium]|nr:30S ribosomal protein S21 [Candidatus Aminicenantes bacterium]
MAYVEVNSGESFESALRRFKRKVQQEAIIKEIKRHTVYLKPGERKRLKVAQAQKRMRKRMRREFSEL